MLTVFDRGGTFILASEDSSTTLAYTLASRLQGNHIVHWLATYVVPFILFVRLGQQHDGSSKSQNLQSKTSLSLVHDCGGELGGDGTDRATNRTFTKIRDEDMPELMVQGKDKRGLELSVLDAFGAVGRGALSSLRRCHQQTVGLLVHDQHAQAFGQ